LGQVLLPEKAGIKGKPVQGRRGPATVRGIHLTGYHCQALNETTVECRMGRCEVNVNPSQETYLFYRDHYLRG